MADVRKYRAITQNIFLIESIIDETKTYEKTYVLMGLTGNVYKVTIKNIPECSCPDYSTRQRRCKHIYFVLIKIMNAPNEDQDKYTDDELSEMFNSIPQITNNLIVDNTVKNKYNKLKPNIDKTNQINKKSTDDLCPICLTELENGDELDYCKNSCGKHVHKVCFAMWTKAKGATCIFCRKDWNTIDTNKKYVNLIN